MSDAMTDRIAVPDIFEEKGRELLADGVRLAHQLDHWVRDVHRLEEACSLLSQQGGLPAQEADAVGAAWLDGSRVSDLYDEAIWMAGRIGQLGIGIAPAPLPWRELLGKINAEVNSALDEVTVG